MSLFGGGTTVTRADKISEFTVNTAEYGAPVTEILGTTRISGNVIYYDDFTAIEHREEMHSGKGGGHTQVNITYTYTVAVALGLCEGEIEGIRQVWIGKNVYTYPSDTIQLTLFKGTKNQEPWAYTVGKHPDKALPYSGLAYMAGVVDLGSGGYLPQYNFEVQGKLLHTGDGIDVNPADYIRYVLDKIGLKEVEIEGLQNYREYCAAADLLISTPSDKSRLQKARDIINDIAKLTNAYIFWSNDRFKIVPLEDRAVGAWEPNRTILYDLTSNDFIPQSGGALVTYQRKDSSAIFNQFPVEFINRDNGYEKESVSYTLTEDVVMDGVRQAEPVQAHYLYTKQRAVKLAEQIARRNKYCRNKYTFKLPWNFCRLEVGDLVSLTDEYSGLDKEVVIIDSVVEDTNGILTFTAISRPPGRYKAPKYEVKDTKRPFVDFNQPAPDTDTPVIIQPPADLTANGLEVWLGARGKEKGWGGCEVYVSDDNTHYKHIGSISAAARMGVLTKGITKDDRDIFVRTNGTFISGTKQDAERGNTLCRLDGECLSYQTAVLQADGTYKLCDCIRGQYHTVQTEHKEGDMFCRIDETLLRVPFRKEDIGKKIWVKLPAYNIFGSGMQEISEVTAYQYQLKPYYIPSVTNVTAYTRYRQLSPGELRYDVVISWAKPQGMQTYLEGDVWYRIVSTEKTTQLADAWTFGGSGETQAVIPQALAGDVYKIAVCTKDRWGNVTDPDFAPYTTVRIAIKSDMPTTPEGVSITFDTVPHVQWQEVTNTDIAYYEVRSDTFPGEGGAALLARTNSTTTAVTLTHRSGTIYVYAKNALGKYSAPAILTYNKPAPPAGKNVVIQPNIATIGIVADPLPEGCIGMTAYINSEVAYSTNNALTYPAKPGIYTIAIAYRDYFGEGEKTPSYMTTVRKTIDPALIAAESITADKIDSAVADAIQSDVLSRVDGKIDTKVEVLQKNVLSRVDGKIDGKLGGLRTDLNGSIDAVRGNVQDLKRRADTLFGQVTGLKESVDGISSVVHDQVQKSVSGFSQRADRLEGMVKDATNSLSALSQRADTIESAVQTATQDKEHIRSQLSSIQQTSAGIMSRVERVERDNEKQYEILHDIDNRENYHNNNLESRITQQADRITSVVGNLSSVESAREAGYTAITQLQDAIGLKVSKGDVKSEVALGLQGVTLSGKQVHITGDTVIDKDVITKGMIQAGAITGDKLDVKDLSSITANIGSVQGGTITGATIRNSDGSFSVSPNGDIKGARIDAASVFASGRALRPVIVSEQRLHSGDTIAYPQGADPAKCLVIVKYFEPLVFVSDNTFTHKPYTEGAIINKYNGYCVQSTHVLVNQWRGEDYDAAKNATGYDWPASVDPEQAQNPKSTYYDTSMHDDGVLHFHEAPMMQWVKQPRMRSNVVYGAGSDCCMDLSAALAMITSGFKVGEFYNNNMRYDRNDYTGHYSNGAVFDQSVAKGKVYNYFGWRLNWGEYWGMRITSGYVDIVVLSFW
ncbi:hypothetical protein HMPREF3033_00727 [Veillonellaceae bacterium DNF00751]|nr:hypothetical protein HMPREF3033_00727 [Veillonellaceae bacterium DNF00751]DAF00835.1 MAG TPA: tail protein [Caudoviricetes sp.]DAM58420.1 MAG TPA: tail protein [Caudoviricetes sp.]